MLEMKGETMMCTAVSFVTKDHYFGRNLDYAFSYEEKVTVMPRNYRLRFRNGVNMKLPSELLECGRDTHYAMIGMAYVVGDFPLYYDGVNEKGLGMAGLLFSGNAMYSSEKKPGMDNIGSFEFIPWILGQCASIEDAKRLLGKINLTDEAFSEHLPPSPLHWMIADRNNTIVVEAVADGLKIYDNPFHVLTNNPPFDFHRSNLHQYMGLTPEEPANTFARNIHLIPFSRGMGAIGLPGDLSSTSRFVKAAFTRMNSVCGESEGESVSQFFHILRSVYQQKGCVRFKGEENEGEESLNTPDLMARDKYEKTIYSSCCNATKGIYYYITYENSCITAIDMHKEALDGEKLVAYPLIKEQQVNWQN